MKDNDRYEPQGYEPNDDDIGIPNVPAIVHDYYQKRNRARLDAGLCPVHNVPLRDIETEEYCPLCAEEESL